MSETVVTEAGPSRPGGDGVHPSRAVRVTFFEDRAEVVRSATVDLPAGTSHVALGGVSPVVADRTVQAAVHGEGVEVVTATVRRRIALERELGQEELGALEREARERAAASRLAVEAIERSQTQKARVDQLLAEWTATLAKVPKEAGEDLSAWKATRATLEARRLTLIEAIHQAQVDKEDADRARARAQARLAAGQARTSRCVTTIAVQLTAQAPTTATVEVTYHVPCALWRPEHLLKLSAVGEDGRAGLEVVTWACVWQRAGEVWEDVEACFSTARPASAANPPNIEDDVLHKRKKEAEERRVVDVAIREEDVSVVGLGADRREVDELPGVDDGGEPRLYRPEAAVTFESNGQPLRVELERRTLPVEVERVLTSELANTAHIKASGTLAGRPLLAGPARIAREGGILGTTSVEFVASGERFELGLGPDDGLRGRRRQRETQKTTPLVGTQKIRRQVDVFVSNIAGATRAVTVTERMPISEIDAVEISLVEADGWELDPKTGFLTQRMNVGAHRVEEARFIYEIVAKASVNLPF